MTVTDADDRNPVFLFERYEAKVMSMTGTPLPLLEIRGQVNADDRNPVFLYERYEAKVTLRIETPPSSSRDTRPM